MNRQRKPSAEAEGARPAVVAEPEPVDPAVAEFDGASEWRTAVVDAAGHTRRLDLRLVAMAPEFSRSHLQSLVERGHVRVDGVVASKPALRVRAGQAVAVELVPTDESRAYTPQPMALAVLHEDEHVLVVDKPAGLVVHPAPGNWSGTLLNGLLARHSGAAMLPRAGIVHRLDKDTSGAMVVGKTLPAVVALVRAIAAREVHREYLALAHGALATDEVTVDKPIGRDPQSRVRMAVVAEARGGRPSRTDVRQVATGLDACALQCTLHSGRTHQIRVHLASLGHPLLADATYGGRPALGLQRQALHALRLGLAHPITGVWLQVEAPAPADFAAAWRRVCGRSVAWSA
ncbi:MAG: RluA family pseudouridine synthase [Rubrivivax sp.]|jgi:23S rRNA pseudouridine1911/1915/1917 synthase|nr:RluA family pseudouridine synthase [Rubrivivax sp.]